MTIKIVVRNIEDGQLAVHEIYNQDTPWSEEQARAWITRVEYDPWEYFGMSYED